MMFLDAPVTPIQFVAALRRYKGIRHSMESSFVKEDFDAPEIAPTGFLQCKGLSFAALRWCGLLPHEFDLNVSKADCFSILRANFHRVQLHEMSAGDLLFLEINGPEDVEHIAHCVSELRPNSKRIIHALNDERGIGRVFEQRISVDFWSQIKSVYRLNIFAGVGLNG